MVAARLRQIRQLRGLSQRDVGIRMGLDKDTASARISRYESEAMTVSLESLFALAQALDVPPAYLLADTPAMADAILALGTESATQQTRLAEAVAALVAMPVGQRKALLERLLDTYRP